MKNHKSLAGKPGLTLLAILFTMQIAFAQQVAAETDLLNVNFASDPAGSSLKTGPAAIGISANDYWNPFYDPWNPEATLDQLKWSDGTVSVIGLTVNNAPGYWGSDLVSDVMYATYVYPHNAEPIQLILRQVPAGSYDLYLYGHGAADDQNATFQVSSGSVIAGPLVTEASPEWTSPIWQEGRQYVVFREIQVVNEEPIRITVSGGASSYAMINGLQLVRQAIPGAINDGIPTSWRKLYFGLHYATDPRSPATADPDGDGAVNFQEYLDDTDPLDPHSLRLAPMAISTFAGTGATGNRDGYRLDAWFNSPVNLRAGPDGRLWVLEALSSVDEQSIVGSHRLRLVGANDKVITVAGGDTPGYWDGRRLQARFSHPMDLVFDTKNNAYIADRNNHRIRKLSPNGSVTTWAGSTPGYRDGLGTEAQFTAPTALAIDKQNQLYVADPGNARIRRITPDGVVTTYAGQERGFQDGALAVARFDSPVCLDMGSDGSLWVADQAQGNGRVRKITPSGLVSTMVDNQGFLHGISVDDAGYFYTSSSITGQGWRLAKYTAQGSLIWQVCPEAGFQDGPIAQAKTSDGPLKPLVLSDTRILFADTPNQRLRQLELASIPLLTLKPQAGTYTQPVSIALTSRIEGAIIRYTLDGQSPSSNSTAFQAAFYLTTSATLKAQAFINDQPVSPVVTSTYTIKRSGVTGRSVKVTRHLPACYTPGTSLKVVLEITPTEGITDYAIVENVPAGWMTLRAPNLDASYQPIQRQIVLGPFNTTTPFTIQYLLLPPSSARKTVYFSGYVSAEKTAIPIFGDTRINPGMLTGGR